MPSMAQLAGLAQLKIGESQAEKPPACPAQLKTGDLFKTGQDNLDYVLIEKAVEVKKEGSFCEQLRVEIMKAQREAEKYILKNAKGRPRTNCDEALRTLLSYTEYGKEGQYLPDVFKKTFIYYIKKSFGRMRCNHIVFVFRD